MIVKNNKKNNNNNLKKQKIKLLYVVRNYREVNLIMLMKRF
jgi:hypothetical protein